MGWYRLALAGLVAALGLAAAPAGIESAVIEVVNGPFESFEQSASLALTPEQASSLSGLTLVEVDGAGAGSRAVPWALDRSGPTPVLSWVMPGLTGPGLPRRFALRRGEPAAAASGDLQVRETEAGITVGNAYFEVTHPRRGGGGFPGQVRFRVSGQRDPDLYFLDRVHRAQGEPEQRGGFEAAADPEASATVAFASPVRVVVEARTRYARGGQPAPGLPRITYRYVYTPFSPVIEVTAEAERDDDLPWNEHHFLHLSRKTYRYSSFLTGEPPAEHVAQAPGTRSVSVAGSHWALMATASDAVGVGGGRCTGWDASDEFVYYVTRSRGAWQARQARLEGCLYIGPAAADAAWYGRWLGPRRQPQVRTLQGVVSPLAAAAVPPEAAHELRHDGLALTFAGAAGGYACTSIQALGEAGARFVHPRDDAPGFWRLTLRTPERVVPEGSTEKPFEEAVVDNRSPSERRAAATATPEGRLLTFTWKGLDLPGEADALDVVATVLLRADRNASEWRLQVTSRSARFGLWESAFPLLTTVCPPGSADVLMPRGNWGGTLMRQNRQSMQAPYPSAGCPVQFMAFNLDQAGLYLGAHDDGARTKSLVISAAQDASVVTLAADAGVPGRAEAVPFTVVVATYAGDWWQAARLYRQWSSRQAWTRKGWIADRADVPAVLKDLGMWWLGGGTADSARRLMQRAGAASTVPVGLHWYNWHEIPFDHTYPEYFPTKPGVAEVVRELVGQGQVIMPYINGRLWDHDIPSFAERGRAAACKRPSGEVYIETYGSGRRLCPMCPTTALWQDTVADICHRLIDECGVNAIYLDQIGAARPAPCFDPGHGHTLGGGRHWVDAYRVMLERIKAEAAAKGVALTTENTAEPYMDTIDAYLAWNPRHDTDVPLLPAVYSGYTLYFTSPQSSADDLDAYALAQGRDFLWGCQLGWNHEWLLEPAHADKLALTLELSRLRLAAKDFMVFGELLDEIRPLEPLPVQTVTWNRRQPHSASLPVVQGTLWRSRSGELGVFLVNSSDRPQAIRYALRPGDWLAAASPAWLVERLTPAGRAPWQESAGPVVEREDILAAREARALVVRAADPAALARAGVLAVGPDAVLSSCARDVLFAAALRQAGLTVALPPAVQRVVRGEPLELSIGVTAERAGTPALSIRWPDGAAEAVTAAPGEAVAYRRLVWAGAGSGDRDRVVLELGLGPQRLRREIEVVYRDAVEVVSACPSSVRGGESFLLPVTVSNHSRGARRVRLQVDCPEGWLVEPGDACDVGELAAGASRSLLLRVRLPAASQSTQASLQVRLVEAASAHEVQVLASRPLALARRAAAPPVIDGRLDEWTLEPSLLLGGDAADTVRITDAYGGAEDCAAAVRLQWDDQALYLGVTVTDNVHHQTETGPLVWRGDAIQLAFRNGPPAAAAGYDGTEYELGLTLGPQGPEVFAWMPEQRLRTDIPLAVVRTGTETCYEAAIPWSALGVTGLRAGRRLAWSMTVNDHDGEGFRGWLEWTPGICGNKDASAFGWFEAVEP